MRPSEASVWQWVETVSRANSSEINEQSGVKWTYSPHPLAFLGAENSIIYPNLSQIEADDLLDKIIHYYAAKQAGIWCTVGTVSTPPHVRRYLKAWGFEVTLSGVTMACDLTNDLMTDFATPAGVEIVQWRERDLFERHPHPYLGKIEDEAGRNTLHAIWKLVQEQSGRVVCFVAMLDGVPVGSTVLMLAEGYAGIFDVGTVAAMRRQHIASATVAAACAYARQQGYTLAVLQNNANLIPLYGGVGFQRDSTIEHWFYPKSRTPPIWDIRRSRLEDPDLLRYEDFIHALTTDQHEQATATLTTHPMIARIRGAENFTALHVAAWNGYSDIVHLLIAAGANVEAQEAIYGGTPLLHAVHGYAYGGPDGDQYGAIEVLLGAGADADSTNRWGESIRAMVHESGDERLRALFP